MPIPASCPHPRAARRPLWPRRLLAFVLGALLLTGPTCLGHSVGAEHAQGPRVAHDSRQSPAAETAGQPSADGPEGPEHCAPTPREKSGRAAQPSARALPATATTADVCRTVVLVVAPDHPHALFPRAPTVRSTLCSTSRWRI
ncbi:hypothetical protein [Streptomyces sp. NEAU-S77]|uniref:hypothetical protein n=1 Tax=Streptomyces sp. NEAU-S77 TaxID=3411033 RepID=UPI003BA2C84E